MIVGLGIDCIGVARIRDVLGRHGTHFLERTYTADEQTYCLQARDPAERLAARWAVKEAAMKALGTGWAEGVGFTQIALVPPATNAPPTLILTGTALARAGSLGATRFLASVSHADGMAVAVVVLEG